MAANDFSPIYVGDVGIPYAPQFLHRDGSVVDLSNATLSIVYVSSTGTRKNGAGVWSIDNASQGLAHYTYDPADVNTAGTWTFQVEVTVNGKPVHTDTDILQIDPPL